MESVQATVKKLNLEKKNDDKRYDDLNMKVRRMTNKINTIDTFKSSL